MTTLIDPPVRRGVLCILLLAALLDPLVACDRPADPDASTGFKPIATAPPSKSALAWSSVPGDRTIATTLATFARDARAAGLKPYAYIHADWCDACKAIEATHATDPKMIDAFQGTAIATIDVDASEATGLAAAGLSTHVLPVFYKLDATGNATGDKIDGGAWGDNIAENMAPPLKAFFAR
jgi:hypothetical protein